MNLFIQTSLDTVKGILAAQETIALLAAQKPALAAFTSIGYTFSGIAPAPPQAWVEPRTSDFAPEGTPTQYIDALTIKLALVGSNPDAITLAAMAYFRVLDQAIQDAEASGSLDATINRIYVRRHDYGPLFEKGGGFGRFPEMHLEVERVEVIE